MPQSALRNLLRRVPPATRKPRGLPSTSKNPPLTATGADASRAMSSTEESAASCSLDLAWAHDISQRLGSARTTLSSPSEGTFQRRMWRPGRTWVQASGRTRALADAGGGSLTLDSAGDRSEERQDARPSKAAAVRIQERGMG